MDARQFTCYARKVAPSPTAQPTELVIRNIDGKTVTMSLDRDRISLGRSSANELCYPDDSGLSRQHLAITQSDGAWFVEDLGSKNGTQLNGQRIEKKLPFRPGDRVSAGHLVIEFAEHAPEMSKTVVFVEPGESFSSSSTTVVQNLEAVIGPPSTDMNKTQVMQGSPQMYALIRAGRELAGHRPLGELFQVILDLSVDAVCAGRGVLMTLDDGALEVRAHGEKAFRFRPRCAIACSRKNRRCWCAMRSSIRRCAST